MIRVGSEFLKACEILGAGPGLIFPGGHRVWHIVGTQCRFVELGRGRVSMQQS